MEDCMNVWLTLGNSIKKQLRRLNKQNVSRGASLLKNCLTVMIVISGNIGEKTKCKQKVIRDSNQTEKLANGLVHNFGKKYIESKDDKCLFDEFCGKCEEATVHIYILAI